MKIKYMGRQINGRFSSFKSALKRMLKFAIRWGLISIAGYALFMGGALLYSTSTVVAETKTVIADRHAPILDRIADCESGNGKPGSASHYKNGQVILKGNDNHTVDIGKYQVNLTYWGAKASQLGLDLTKEEDNYKMALWIYENKGTTDWSASMKCWYK